MHDNTTVSFIWIGRGHSSCAPQLCPCLWLIACCSIGHKTVYRYQSLIKPKVVNRSSAVKIWGARTFQCYVNQPNWQANWTYENSTITSLLLNGIFVRRMTDLEKTELIRPTFEFEFEFIEKQPMKAGQGLKSSLATQKHRKKWHTYTQMKQ